MMGLCIKNISVWKKDILLACNLWGLINFAPSSSSPCQKKIAYSWKVIKMKRVHTICKAQAMFWSCSITFILQALPEVWVMTIPVQFWDHLGKGEDRDSQTDVVALGFWKRQLILWGIKACCHIFLSTKISPVYGIIQNVLFGTQVKEHHNVYIVGMWPRKILVADCMFTLAFDWIKSLVISGGKFIGFTCLWRSCLKRLVLIVSDV